MKIGVLTSSRADSGIYTPLLKALKNDPFFELEIIAFGTHLSEKFGYTVKTIEADGYFVPHKIDTMPEGDKPEHITCSMGKTMINFAKLWSSNQFDIVFALGDRFEMFAAVASSTPFNIKIAHLHGGETTLGAIDNAFRHSITHMSSIHFASTEEYAKRVIELIGHNENVYNVGALGFDNLSSLQLLSIEDFKEKYTVDLTIPTILITFHPETISYENNEKYALELVESLSEIKGYQFLFTMPNADTMGNIIREKLNVFIKNNNNAFGFENLGTLGYLSAMKHCSFMMGNTSSGCIEASYFPQWVINLGDRQKGRIVTPNMINCIVEKTAILKTVQNIRTKNIPEKISIYGDGNSATKIIKTLKQIHG